MENKISEPMEHQEPNSVTEVVAGVLAEDTKKNTFLQNVGIQNRQPTSDEQNLEAELLAEKRANAELRLMVNSQQEELQVLSMKLQEEEHARMRDWEENARKQAETDAKIDLMFNQIRRN